MFHLVFPIITYWLKCVYFIRVSFQTVVFYFQLLFLRNLLLFVQEFTRPGMPSVCYYNWRRHFIFLFSCFSQWNRFRWHFWIRFAHFMTNFIQIEYLNKFIDFSYWDFLPTATVPRSGATRSSHRSEPVARSGSRSAKPVLVWAVLCLITMFTTWLALTSWGLVLIGGCITFLC